MCKYQRRLPGPRQTKSAGFTLVEVITVVTILLVLLAGLFSALSIGDLSGLIGGAKLEIQQQARNALDWMTKDLRQTSRNKLTITDVYGQNMTFADPSLGANDTFTKPRFYICMGYYPENSSINWTANQTEYEFDATNRTVIRTDYGTGNIIQFNKISNLTFTKIDRDSLSIDITAQETTRGNATTTVNLQGEVSLRNE